MNIKKIVMIVVVIVALGVGGFVVMNSDNETNNNQQTPENQTEQSTKLNDNSNDNLLGLDYSSLSGPYRLTIKSDEDGVESTILIEADKNGNTSTRVTSDGETSVILQVDGATYVQDPSDGTWLKYPASTSPQENSDFSSSFTAQDVQDLNDSSVIVEKGTGECTAGECRIYESTDKISNDKTIIKVDVKTNRLSDIETVSSTGATTSISYDYTSVDDIVAPEGAVEFNLDTTN